MDTNQEHEIKSETAERYSAIICNFAGAMESIARVLGDQSGVLTPDSITKLRDVAVQLAEDLPDCLD